MPVAVLVLVSSKSVFAPPFWNNEFPITKATGMEGVTQFRRSAHPRRARVTAIVLAVFVTSCYTNTNDSDPACVRSTRRLLVAPKNLGRTYRLVSADEESIKMSDQMVDPILENSRSQVLPASSRVSACDCST